jgi:nitroreductase
MNEILENMKTRRSVRSYDPERMPEEILFEAGDRGRDLRSDGHGDAVAHHRGGDKQGGARPSLDTERAGARHPVRSILRCTRGARGYLPTKHVPPTSTTVRW